jgi:hypothetical protein
VVEKVEPQTKTVLLVVRAVVVRATKHYVLVAQEQAIKDLLVAHLLQGHFWLVAVAVLVQLVLAHQLRVTAVLAYPRLSQVLLLPVAVVVVAQELVVHLLVVLVVVATRRLPVQPTLVVVAEVVCLASIAVLVERVVQAS